MSALIPPTLSRREAMIVQHNAEDGLTSALAELRGLVDQLIDDQIARLDAVPEESAPGQGTARLSAGPLSVFDPTWEHGRHSVLPLVATVLKPKAPVSSPAPQRPLQRVSVHEASAEAPVERDGHNPRDRLDALARHLNDRIRKARDTINDKPKPEAQA